MKEGNYVAHARIEGMNHVTFALLLLYCSSVWCSINSLQLSFLFLRLRSTGGPGIFLPLKGYEVQFSSLAQAWPTNVDEARQ